MFLLFFSFDYLFDGYMTIIFKRGGRLLASESDVCRRQILTSIVGPRTERVKQVILLVHVSADLATGGKLAGFHGDKICSLSAV